jgi:hypothetical protein
LRSSSYPRQNHAADPGHLEMLALVRQTCKWELEWFRLAMSWIRGRASKMAAHVEVSGAVAGHATQSTTGRRNDRVLVRRRDITDGVGLARRNRGLADTIWAGRDVPLALPLLRKGSIVATLRGTAWQNVIPVQQMAARPTMGAMTHRR